MSVLQLQESLAKALLQSRAWQVLEEELVLADKLPAFYVNLACLIRNVVSKVLPHFPSQAMYYPTW